MKFLLQRGHVGFEGGLEAAGCRVTKLVVVKSWAACTTWGGMDGIPPFLCSLVCRLLKTDHRVLMHATIIDP